MVGRWLQLGKGRGRTPTQTGLPRIKTTRKLTLNRPIQEVMFKNHPFRQNQSGTLSNRPSFGARARLRSESAGPGDHRCRAGERQGPGRNGAHSRVSTARTAEHIMGMCQNRATPWCFFLSAFERPNKEYPQQKHSHMHKPNTQATLKTISHNQKQATKQSAC